MPYIKHEDRVEIGMSEMLVLAEKIFKHNEVGKEGRMNYVISRLIDLVYKMDNPSYSKINEAIGVIECVKQELYRRVASPYEDKKISENGDVY